MAYIPTEWETGDVITAEKLNNMEQGIEDAFVAPIILEGDMVTENGTDYTFTLTSGDVENLELAPNIFVKAHAKLSIGGTDTPLADLLLPLIAKPYSSGSLVGYTFANTAQMQNGVYFAALDYRMASEEWVADLTILT